MSGGGSVGFTQQFAKLNAQENLAAFLATNPELAGEEDEDYDNLDVQHDRVPQVARRVERTRLDTIMEWLCPGDPDVNFLLTNFLSSKWTTKNIDGTLPIIYAVGIVGYAVALPIRVTIFVVSFLNIFKTFFAAIFTGEWHTLGGRMKTVSLVFLGATGELVSGVIGVLCPPAAYKLDELIQSNETIHKWYFDTFLSYWRKESRQIPAIFGLQEDVDRVELKKDRVGKDIKYFKNAITDKELGLREYLTKDEIDDQIVVLDKIVHQGILLSFANGSFLTVVCNEAVDKCATEDEKEIKRQNLNKHIDQFKKYWNALIKQESSFGSFFSKDNDQTKGKLKKEELIHAIHAELLLKGAEKSFLNGKKAELENKLTLLEKTEILVGKGENKITVREAIRRLSTAIEKFANEVVHTDREMFRALTQAAYPEAKSIEDQLDEAN